jgi:UDP-N-acetylmuramoylalanine--D-glutamate ligase
MNSDDPSVSSTDVPEGPRRVRFSPSGHGANNGYSARLGDELFLSKLKIKTESLPLLGEHNIANAMMAWELASAVLGEPTEDQAAGMLSALLSFKGLANRMEVVGERGGVLVVNNSMCTNPSAVVASSKGLKRRQHLIVGGNRKQLDFTPVGEYLNSTNHRAYLFGPDTEGLNVQLNADWPAFSSMEEAFMAATREAEPGDAIVLMPGCSSAEPFANFRERGDAFRELAKRWIES